MATKKELLKNLRNFTPEEIAGAVKNGTVTLYELAKESEGAFTPLLRKQVKEILDTPTPAQTIESEIDRETASSTISETEEQTIHDNIQIDTEEITVRRLEYGISFIIYFIWYLFVDVAGKSSNLSQGVAIIILISIIPILWFLWAQNCKRCHDRGNSGWYQLIPFYFFVLLFGDGEPGENEYGTNPKE